MSADDTTIALISPTKRHFLIVGAGIQYNVMLPDARTLRVGTPFVFENMSPEFVGVYNSDLTLWYRIPPGGSVLCVLGAQATAAGVWFSTLTDPAVGDPSCGLSAFCDFLQPIISNTIYSEVGLYRNVGGAGAAIVSTSVTWPGRQGTVAFTPGTDAAGLVVGYGAYLTGGFIGSACRALTGSVAFNVASVAADEYIGRFGVGDKIDGTAHTEGAYFYYDRLGAGVNWQFKTVKTAGGAGSTTTDTGVVPAVGNTGSEWQRLRVEIASTGGRADAWVDNTLVTPVGGQANLPAATTGSLKYVNVGVTNSATTGVSRWMRADYIHVQSYPSTLR